MVSARSRELESLCMFTRFRCDRPVHRLLLLGIDPNDRGQQSVYTPLILILAGTESP